jgi:hypothetical protein
LWFEEGSQFVERLLARLRSSGLDAEIDPLLWSGANSINDRWDAAQSLANRLREQQERDQNVRQVIIGHSHGGTVAMLAMQRLWRRPPVLITLATPFMEAQYRFLSDRFNRSVEVLWMIVLASIFLPGYGNLKEMVTAAVAGGLVAIVTFLFVGRLTFSGMLVEAWAKKDIKDKKDNVEIGDHLTLPTRGGLTLSGNGPVLVIRGVDDEAGLVLAAGAIGNRLSSNAYIWSALIVWYAVSALLFVIVAANALALLGLEIRPYVQTFLQATLYSGYLRITALILVASCVLLPIVCGAFKSVYGREFFFKAFRCQINSHSSPDCQTNLHVVTLRPPVIQTGFRHKIYDNEKAPEVAADFIYRSFHASENRNSLSSS